MPNKTHIKNVEAYLADMQAMEVNIGKKNAIDRVILSHMTKETLYTSIREMESMQHDLEDLLLRMTMKSGSRGKLMAKDAMTRFLEKSERRVVTQKQLRLVDKLNTRQMEKRTELYLSQVKSETSGLSNQISLFIQNAQASGRTKADALKELIKAAGDDAGMAAGFEKRLKRITLDAARHEGQMQAMEEYKKVALPGEKWQWITVSTTPCPDCQARAAVILSWDAWVSMGLPGTGRTVCMTACRCQLVPVSVADEQFPDAKQFTWDKEKLVLTTAGEARRFAADSNQP